MPNEPNAANQVDHYGAQYSNFLSEVLAAVRKQAFVEDFGQNGWQTANEQDLFIDHLALDADSRLLDVACGSGGRALRIVERAGCSVVGIDLHEEGVATARRAATERGFEDRTVFERAASQTLSFEDESFDAINHLADRAHVLSEFARILAPGGRLPYTDPIVVTGWLTDEDLRIRSSIGFFLFVPPGINEALLDAAGFEVDAVQDRTENMAIMAAAWRDARAERAEALRQIEGDAAFEGQQIFFDVAARLASERRLARFAFPARKRQAKHGLSQRGEW